MNCLSKMSKTKKEGVLSILVSKNQDQSGRSMVEIIAVLAIIGILSISGIAGYTRAVSKHRSNELLNKTSQLATLIAGQIMAGSTPSLSSSNGERDLGFAVFDNQVYGEDCNSSWDATKDKMFSIKMTWVKKDVCQNLQTMVGGIVQVFNPSECGDNETVCLTYNNDLSTEKIENASQDTTPLKDCSNYQGTSSNNTGGYAGLATDGTTPCNCPARKKWDNNNSTCEDLEEGECTSYTSQECPSGQYCSFESSATNDGCTDTGGGICTEGVGSCTPIFNGTQVTTSNDGFVGLLTGTKMNWWTAQSWCIAHGMQMPSLSEFECFHDDDKVSGWNCDWSRFKGRLAQSNFWVTDDPDCRARNLAANGNRIDFDTPKTEHYYSTLCTNGSVQQRVLSQVGEPCTNSSDCAKGLFCNASNVCETKLDDGVVCSSSESCKSGHCGQNGGASDVCFTSCTSHTTNECGSGYYCVFNYPYSCEDSGTGACMPIINGSTLTEEDDGVDGYLISNKMNWWSASSLCAAHNKHLASLSEMGCTRGDSCEDCCENRSRFYNGKLNQSGVVSWWTSDNNNCVAYNITLNGGTRVDFDTQRTNSTYYSVVCK